MINSRPVAICFLLLSISLLFCPVHLHAEGAETIDDALSVIDLALENDEPDAIQSLISTGVGVEIAGISVAADEFIVMSHDTEPRELTLYGEEELITRKSSLEEFLWGDYGAFTVMRDVTMSHSL